MNRFLLPLAALSLVACGDSPQGTPSEALPTVVVRVVEAAALPPSSPLVGRVRASQQAILVARIPASVASAEPLGATLAAGQAPVTLVAPEVAARLAAAKAEDARLAADLAREERLLKEGAAAPEVVRSLRQQAAAAAAMAEEAAAHAAQLAPAAPFAGKVLRSPLRAGDTVLPGTLLAEMAADGPLVVEVDIPLAFPAIEVGAVLRVVVGDRSAEARLAELAPAAGKGARVRSARLSLPASGGFVPGDVVRVDWLGVGAPLVTMPEAAIIRRSQMEQVAVVREGKVVIRLVRLAGSAGEGRVAVATGLAPGEQVVVEAKSALRDGQPVEVTR